MRSHIFLSILLAACSDYDIAGGDKLVPGADDGTAPDILVDPALIAFGQVEVGTGLSITENVTVTNLGDAALEIYGMRLDSDYGAVYTVSAISSVLVAPGATSFFTVTYEPLTAIEYGARVLIDSNDPDEPQASVELTAEGVAPMILLTPDDYSYGTLDIGCGALQPVTIKNAGNANLIITELAYAAASVDELQFDANLAVNGALPWELLPDEEVQVLVEYTPLDDYPDEAYLSVTSNDPAQPDAQAWQDGGGRLIGENRDVFEQPIRGASDILFVIDNSSSMGNEQASLAANFEFFAAGLVALEVDYQLAVITVDDPEFQGTARGVPIITEDTDDVVAEFIAQTNVGLISGVTESPSEMAYQSTSSGGDAGPGSDFLRDDARLAVIVVSDEPDYSPEEWAFYLAHFQGLKADVDDVVVHAISGDWPSGCGDASATDKVYQMTVETGGLYLSVCAADWASHLEALVEASSADLTSFELTEEPVPETIVVRVDGITTTVGWTYDAVGRSVDFDESHIPDGGSTIEVEYALQGDCEG
ncbi:MAG: choice-of-anchor D domain-containing protein [Myxococcota bacterium]